MNDECNKIFNGLVDNALSFLHKSIIEFDTDIKYSIIHFCIALENLLKAELLHEHWSLIFKKPEKAKWNDFISGDFLSVSVDETIERLMNIGGRKIDNEAKLHFRSIVNERNRIIHFCNEDIPKDKVALSQFHAWYHIDKLLREWHKHFMKFSNSKNEFRHIMAKQFGFLEIKYKNIEPQLLNIDKSKVFISECQECNYKSIIVPKKICKIIDSKCKVCEHVVRGIVIVCPECSKTTLVTEDHKTICACKKDLSTSELTEIIEMAIGYHADIQHGGIVDWIANCSYCEGTHSVIQLNDNLWFCVNCFETFNKVSVCEWCNEIYTGEREDTFAFGCCSCDGYVGWDKRLG